jgi:hypothetical protein
MYICHKLQIQKQKTKQNKTALKFIYSFIIVRRSDALFPTMILYLLCELASLNLNKGSCHSTHVAPWVVERDTTGANRVFVLVCVNACQNTRIYEAVASNPK